MFNALLPKPESKKPFFGEGSVPKNLKQIRDNWYEDVALLACPVSESGTTIADVDERRLKELGRRKSFSLSVEPYDMNPTAHKPYGEGLKPGVTMGPYGVHWDRGQTWWPIKSIAHVNTYQFKQEDA